MNDKKQMLMGSLIGDSHALGYHWIYDQQELLTLQEKMEHLHAPVQERFHTHKKPGEHTHYGDQVLILLRYLAKDKTFSKADFHKAWTHTMTNYTGYMDHASKEALQRPKWGSQSIELGGAARIAPLVYLFADNEEKLFSAVQEQTAVSHNNSLTLQTAYALAQITLRVLQGTAPKEAIISYQNSCMDKTPLLRKLFQKAFELLPEEPLSAIQNSGQSCSIKGAFPAVLYCAMKYESDYKQAIIMNTLAGGDQAARALAIGMILGAAGCSIPQNWIETYAYRDTVEEILKELP